MTIEKEPFPKLPYHEVIRHYDKDGKLKSSTYFKSEDIEEVSRPTMLKRLWVAFLIHWLDIDPAQPKSTDDYNIVIGTICTIILASLAVAFAVKIWG